jgi:hypothetical protein
MENLRRSFQHLPNLLELVIQYGVELVQIIYWLEVVSNVVSDRRRQGTDLPSYFKDSW